MPKIKNMGSATMRFGEGLIVTGSAGTDTHSLVVTGSTTVLGDITCNNINIGADAAGTGRTISAGNTDTSIRFNAADGVDIVVGGSFFISCDENASQDTVVINEASKDIDFRVESNSKQHQIYSDANLDLLVLGSDIAIPNGVGSDTNVIISGSQDGQGNTVFTGDVVASGSLNTKVDLLVDGRIGIGNTSPDDAVDVNGNVRISNYLRLNCAGTTDPTGSPPLLNHAHIYSKLSGGTAEVFVQDSDGNVTQISPHNPAGEWHYFSRNTRTGKVVRINMEKMIRKLEEITGESFMEEWYEDPTNP